MLMKKVALAAIGLMISAAASAAPKGGIPPGLSGTGGLPPGFVHAYLMHLDNLPPGLVNALAIQLAHCEMRTGSPCELPVSP
jgi:hypothetical protein